MVLAKLMTYTIEMFTQGVWAPVSQHKSRELAEAEVGIKIALRINGKPLHERHCLRIIPNK
tara:strand:+ start:1149 stop:1331 length:183 start_codon:yes stop_codon:yes gene_type:complete